MTRSLSIGVACLTLLAFAGLAVPEAQAFHYYGGYRGYYSAPSYVVPSYYPPPYYPPSYVYPTYPSYPSYVVPSYYGGYRSYGHYYHGRR